MLPTRLSYKSAARATTSTTVSRLQLTSSTSKSSGPCYFSKTNNKLWWLRNTGITSSDPKWPFLRLICHLCISDTRPFVGMRDQGGAQLVPRWHLPGYCRAERSLGSQPCQLYLHASFLVYPRSVAALTQTRHYFHPRCLLCADLLQLLPRTAIPGSTLLKKGGSTSSLPPPHLPPSCGIICSLVWMRVTHTNNLPRSCDPVWMDDCLPNTRS